MIQDLFPWAYYNAMVSICFCSEALPPTERRDMLIWFGFLLSVRSSMDAGSVHPALCVRLLRRLRKALTLGPKSELVVVTCSSLGVVQLPLHMLCVVILCIVDQINPQQCYAGS